MTTWGESTMMLLYFQVCLLQGVIFICVNICIFHSRFCFPCSMSVMLEQPILSLSISFPRCSQNNFQCSFCAGPITSVSLSSCNHKFSSKWSIITYAARRVQVLWRFLSLFFKGSHRFGVLPVFFPPGHICSMTAPKQAHFQISPALVPVSTVCRQLSL